MGAGRPERPRLITKRTGANQGKTPMLHASAPSRRVPHAKKVRRTHISPSQGIWSRKGLAGLSCSSVQLRDDRQIFAYPTGHHCSFYWRGPNGTVSYRARDPGEVTPLLCTVARSTPARRNTGQWEKRERPGSTRSIGEGRDQFCTLPGHGSTLTCLLSGGHVSHYPMACREHTALFCTLF